MPVSIQKKGKRYSVKTPGGVKAKGTTLEKAKAQERLLNAIDHGWRPKKKGYGLG
jgi:ribosomal protein S6E (S10)